MARVTDISGFVMFADSCLDGAGQGNIDQLCSCFSQFTGQDCPPPEMFGAGDRSVEWTIESFAATAADGFGLDSTPAVPSGGGGSSQAGGGGGSSQAGGGGGSSQAGGGAPRQGGMSIGLLVAGAFIVWLLLSD